MDKTDWYKSSYSGPNTDACVEVKDVDGGGKLVRDSKNPDGPVLAFTPQEWTAFTQGVRAGEFDA